MAHSTDFLYEDLFDLIQKDKFLADKKQLLADMIIINDEAADKKTKRTSFERLIKYISYLPKWDEELMTYLGNRYAKVK